MDEFFPKIQRRKTEICQAFLVVGLDNLSTIKNRMLVSSLEAQSCSFVFAEFDCKISKDILKVMISSNILCHVCLQFYDHHILCHVRRHPLLFL